MTLYLGTQLSFDYDEEEDVLYAWVGAEPQEAVTHETPEGHLVRLDPETGEFMGVTILDYKERWEGSEIALSWENGSPAKQSLLQLA